MKPEDLVGRRIRFLPKGKRNGQTTIHNFKVGQEAVVARCVLSQYNKPERRLMFLVFKEDIFIRPAHKTREHHAWPNVDFEVIDDDGEMPYSWRV